MRDWFVLIAHLIITTIRTVTPGGARAVIAESLLLKHQLLILNRSRRKAPRLRTLDRILLGLGCSDFTAPTRLSSDSSEPFDASISIGPFSGTARPASLNRFATYYNDRRVHAGLNGQTPFEQGGTPAGQPAALDHYTWRSVGIVNKVIPGGRCASLRHVGSEDTLDAAIRYLYAQWLPTSGEELRDYPLFLQRISFFPDVSEHEAVTDTSFRYARKSSV